MPGELPHQLVQPRGVPARLLHSLVVRLRRLLHIPKLQPEYVTVTTHQRPLVALQASGKQTLHHGRYTSCSDKEPQIHKERLYKDGLNAMRQGCEDGAQENRESP